ncbi:hypothetical protein AVEN_168967-1 [Araneus ventricosus]|uniref:Uncharacterized protein n=1 Tax=Araneus ventricosus TaxID=182803 RepID=A0A4Y2L5S1_ARAVE|nr:hypothetical protein AVEN_234931-1 [Araneus ventricosus]GBN09173.1 hypothetical protein AVEN_168967-1 [Araneus ventricosus]
MNCESLRVHRKTYSIWFDMSELLASNQIALGNFSRTPAATTDFERQGPQLNKLDSNKQGPSDPPIRCNRSGDRCGQRIGPHQPIYRAPKVAFG